MICVLTACVEPGDLSQLELRDSKERLRQYIKALHFYLKCKEIKKIVFCDNSNYPYSYVKEKQLSEKYGKQLEILKYREDACMVQQKGKGYGEGRIMEYVLAHSELMQTETYFYKITGRLIIKNIDIILKYENRDINYFNWNLYSYGTIDTRFFGVNKEIFQKNLLKAYKRVNDQKGKYLEHCFMQEIEKRDIPYKGHVLFPIFVGMSGTVGKMYRQHGLLMRGIYNFLSWTDLYNCKIVYDILYERNQNSCGDKI